MPIRNPFARRPGAAVNDENLRPESADGVKTPPAFERVDTVGSKASSAMSIRSARSQDTGEYKMSVVNDSGVYLPPSPTENEAAWPRRYLSRTSSDTRSSTGDIEHFSISRESFDSYRRSFDITAKSPIISIDPAPRQSLDSARFPRLTRTSMGERRFEREPPTPEEGFEEVGLNDEQKPLPPPQPHSRRRGFFSKFGGEQHAETTTTPATAATSAPAPAPSAMSRFGFPGRKRGQSGQGAELGHIERPATAGSAEPQEVAA